MTFQFIQLLRTQFNILKAKAFSVLFVIIIIYFLLVEYDLNQKVNKSKLPVYLLYVIRKSIGKMLNCSYFVGKKNWYCGNFVG